MLSSIWLQLGLWLTICVRITAAGTHKSFQSAKQAGVSLRYVCDSGICETTPGVHQASGYVDIEPNMHLVGRHLDSDLITNLVPTVVLVL